jgi:hypothetical protein
MRSLCCLCVPPPQCLKAEIVAPEETIVARQRLDKHFLAATNTKVNNIRTGIRGVFCTARAALNT